MGSKTKDSQKDEEITVRDGDDDECLCLDDDDEQQNDIEETGSKPSTTEKIESNLKESPKAAEKDVENSHSENDENDASDDVVDITNGDEDETKRDLEEENEKDRKINGDDAGSEVITVDDSIDIDPVPTKTVITDEEFFGSVSAEEKLFYESAVDPDAIENMSISCTACSKQVNHHITNNIQRHPELGVPICRTCKGFYEDDGDWEKDEQGSDCYCRWCANGGEMVCCDKCSNAFCKRCIQGNLGRKKYNQINDLEKWECFLCDPTPIFKQRALMWSISKWLILRKDKKKLKDKEAKMKETKKVNEMKQKKSDAELAKVENFIDENIHEAFESLKIYQKCLEDERRRWFRSKKAMNPDTAASIAIKLRKLYDYTRQNMQLLDTALVQSYLSKFPDQTLDKLKISKTSNASTTTGSPKAKKTVKIGPTTTPATKTKPAPPSTSKSTNGPSKVPSPGTGVNKRKMKDTSRISPKKSKPSGDDDIAVEEIVVNGDPILGNQDFFDPSQLCSIQITGKSTPPAPPSIPPVRRPTGPLKLSNKMFKKKSPVKPTRPATPDSDIEEITIDDKNESDIDSDVSLE